MLLSAGLSEDSSDGRRKGGNSMKKLMNNAEDFIPEMLEGLYAAHSDQITAAEGKPTCLVSTKKKENKVALVTGGGSGHLPLFLGYVGEGMLDGCAIGGIFQSPSADDMLTVTKNVEAGKGVLYILGNYNGDKYNFKMAGEMADMEYDIVTDSVIAGDDVASGPVPEPGEVGIRRGVAGIFFVYKCAGAAADEGMDLPAVKAIAERAAHNVRTMGVALSPCTVPRVGKPSFTIADDEMELGMGIHGEPGIKRCKLMNADDTVSEMMGKILPDLPFQSGDEVAVLVNGLGATPLEEQYLVYGIVAKHLKEAGLRVHRTYVGEFATSLEMAGLSISVFKLDDELKRLLDKRADTPFFKQF